MFTGLIQEKGKIVNLRRIGQTIQLTCEASENILNDYNVGDSMAINGVCLTAVSKESTRFSVDIMPETYQRTTFHLLKLNDAVNLERAMSFNDRFEGHIVAGHSDSTTRLLKKRNNRNALMLTFEYPKQLMGEIVPQGSITINGVSLTVTDVVGMTFSIGLIPHSKEETTLGTLTSGDLVNIETDVLGKYVKAQLNWRRSKNG